MLMNYVPIKMRYDMIELVSYTRHQSWPPQQLAQSPKGCHGCRGKRTWLRDALWSQGPIGDVGVWACAGNHTTICQKWVQKCQKLSKMAQKIQPRSSTLGSYPKISKTMDGWWVDINWRMADIAKLHKSSHIEYFSWQTRSPLLNQIKHTWKQILANQSYIPRIFWKLVRRQIFPQNHKQSRRIHSFMVEYYYIWGKKTTQ